MVQPTIQPNASLESELNTPSRYIIDHAMCFLQKIIIFGNLTECLTGNNDNNSTDVLVQKQDDLETENSYYLAVYIAIAIFNSLIALVRSFAFAYAGIKAAKFIHNRLLYSVIYVSDLRFFFDKFQFSFKINSLFFQFRTD